MSNELRGKESYNLQEINSTNPISGHNFFNVEVAKVDSCSTLSIFIYIWYILMVASLLIHVFSVSKFTPRFLFLSLFFMNLNFGMGYCCLIQSHVHMK